MKMQWQVPPIRQQCPAPTAFIPDTVPQLSVIYIHRQSSRKGQLPRHRWQEYKGGKIYFLSYMFNIRKQRILLVLIIEWFGLERVFKDHLVQPTCKGQEHLQLDQVAHPNRP